MEDYWASRITRIHRSPGEFPAQGPGQVLLSIHKGCEMQKIEIHIKGQIDKQWSEWFGDLKINHSDPDETVLTGLAEDQASLYGVISRVRDLGLQLSSVRAEEIKEDSHERK